MRVYNIVFWSRNLQPLQAPNQESNPKHKQKKLCGSANGLTSHLRQRTNTKHCESMFYLGQKPMLLFQPSRHPYIYKLSLNYLPDV
jgi:hypothetical protein